MGSLTYDQKLKTQSVTSGFSSYPNLGSQINGVTYGDHFDR